MMDAWAIRPAFGNACECQSPLRKGAIAASGRFRAQQDRLNLPFPAVQGRFAGQESVEAVLVLAKRQPDVNAFSNFCSAGNTPYS